MDAAWVMVTLLVNRQMPVKTCLPATSYAGGSNTDWAGILKMKTIVSVITDVNSLIKVRGVFSRITKKEKTFHLLQLTVAVY